MRPDSMGANHVFGGARSRRTGFTPTQIKNQLSPGRSNLRSKLEEIAKTV